MRIEHHPILVFEKGQAIVFYYNGKTMTGYESDTIASALHASGVRHLSHSEKNQRPRGFYCAIGNCSSSLMEVNGQANVRVCIEPLIEGMQVKNQKHMGALL